MYRAWTVALLFAVAALSGCGISSGAPGGAPGKVEVVAAENFWGSIAAQLGGDRVHVLSIVNNPDTDPHSYEAKPADAGTIAGARYVIVNGAGYDAWVPKLLDANPVAERRVLVVGDMLGKREGDNPHFWYSPAYVASVIDRITADLKSLDGGDAAYFDQQRSSYRQVALKPYNDTINAIRGRYAGVPVGATENIFAYTAQSLGLNLVTPPQYMKAISEGTDPSASDKATMDLQLGQKQVRLLVYNSQNTTPEVNALVDKARARGIPVAPVTETLSPAGTTFQDWQTRQLETILAALGG